MKNFAEDINCMSTDALVSLETRDLRRANVVFLDECVLRNALLFHGLP